MLKRVWRKWNHLTLLGGMYIGATTMERSMEIPQKTKNRTTIGSSNPTPGHFYPEKTMTCKDTCTPMFTAAPFTIAKTWKQTKCLPTDEWIKKI